MGSSETSSGNDSGQKLEDILGLRIRVSNRNSLICVAISETAGIDETVVANAIFRNGLEKFLSDNGLSLHNEGNKFVCRIIQL